MFDTLKRLMGIAYPLPGGPEPVTQNEVDAKAKNKATKAKIFFIFPP